MSAFVSERDRSNAEAELVPIIGIPPIARASRDGVRQEKAGREEPEDAARIRLAAGQQAMLRLQPARADLRQHDDRLVRLHFLLWYAVSNSLPAHASRSPFRRRSVFPLVPVEVPRPGALSSSSSLLSESGTPVAYLIIHHPSVTLSRQMSTARTGRGK